LIGDFEPAAGLEEDLVAVVLSDEEEGRGCEAEVDGDFDERWE